MSRRLLLLNIAILTIALLFSGCRSLEPRPLSNRPTATPAPPTPAPTSRPTHPKPTAAVQAASAGAAAWNEVGCNICHGSRAQGGIGPALAHTQISPADFIYTVRNAAPPMPIFSEAEASDATLLTIYGWLQSLPEPSQTAQGKTPVIVKVQPGQTELPEGPILGMSLWTDFGCEKCHGVFAQGGPDAPMPLAGISDPPEVLLQNMRKTADTIPEHAADYMTDPIFERLYHWLQSGANPAGGC